MKKLLYVICALLLVLVIALVSITSMVDTDKVKAMLMEQVKSSTGADLVVSGDLSWQFFPRLGFTLGKTELRNSAGFSELNLIEFSRASMDLAVKPLFDRRIEVGEMTLSGVKINVLTRANGQTNIDAFSQKMAATSTKPAAPGEAKPTDTPEEEKSDFVISIAGINIDSGQLLLRDEVSKKQQLVSNINLEMKGLALAQMIPVVLSADYAAQGLVARIESGFNLSINRELDVFDIGAMKTHIELAGNAVPSGSQTVTLMGDVNYQLNNNLADIKALTLTALAHTFTGNASFQQSDIPKIRFTLVSEQLDVDALLAQLSTSATPAPSNSTAPTDAPAPSVEKEKPVDLSVLSSMDLAGDLMIKQVLVANAKLDQLELKATIAKGVAQLSDIKAQLYQGHLAGSVSLNGTQTLPRFTLQQRLSGVQVLPLMTALAKMDKLAGTMNANIDVKGTGLSDAQIRQSLAGTADLQFTNGALIGINLAQMVRKAKAQLKGQSAADVPEKQTDFSALTGSFDIGKGVAKTQNLHMESPALRVSGKGNTQLVTEQLDFLVDLAVVGSLKGQGGKSEQELAGFNVPLKITGNWQAPAFSLDMEALLKQQMQQHGEQLKEKLDQELDKRIKDEGTKELLKKLPIKDLFG